jgi:hypothetical protein
LYYSISGASDVAACAAPSISNNSLDAAKRRSSEPHLFVVIVMAAPLISKAALKLLKLSQYFLQLVKMYFNLPVSYIPLIGYHKLMI